MADRAAAWMRGGRNAVLAVIITTGIAGVLAYSAAESFGTEVSAAIRYGLAFPGAYPLSLEGVLVSLLVGDAWTTWRGEPMWPVRTAVRFFNLAIIGINTQAGWPNPWAMLMHAIPPFAFALSVEIALYWILRHKHQAERAAKRAARAQRRACRQAARARRREDHEEDRRRREGGIPVARWLLEPGQTYSIWRLIVTREATSYKSARELHRRRRVAFEVALRRWPTKGMNSPEVPVDLAWRLFRGVDLTNALREWKSLIEEQDRIRAVEARIEVMDREHAEEAAALQDELVAERAARAAAEGLAGVAREAETEAVDRAVRAEEELADARRMLAGRRRNRSRANRSQSGGSRGGSTGPDGPDADRSGFGGSAAVGSGTGWPGGDESATGLSWGAGSAAVRLDSDGQAIGQPGGNRPDGEFPSRAGGARSVTNKDMAISAVRADPSLLRPRMGAELGRRIGASDRTGGRLHARLVDGDLRDRLTDLLAD